MPAGHECGEFRWAGVFFMMVGKVFTKRIVKDPNGYRAQLDKSAYMKVLAALVASKALPEHGINPTFNHEPRRQHNLAMKLGLKCRESFSRNFRKSPRILNKSFKRDAKASVYEFAFNQGQAVAKEHGGYIEGVGYKTPRAGELRKDPVFGDYWRELKDRFKSIQGEISEGVSDYAFIPGWIFNPFAPGGPLDRLVLLVLAFHGLMAIDHKTGRMKKEMLQLSYPYIAACLGIHRDTVQRCVNFWVKIGLLSVQEQPGFYSVNGVKVDGPCEGSVWTQESNKIWYLPGKEFNELQAQIEKARFQRTANLGGLRKAHWFQPAEEIHGAVLKEFAGKRHTISGFWTECSDRMRRRGIHEDFIRAVIPRPPG